MEHFNHQNNVMTPIQILLTGAITVKLLLGSTAQGHNFKHAMTHVETMRRTLLKNVTMETQVMMTDAHQVVQENQAGTAQSLILKLILTKVIAQMFVETD